MLLKEFRSHAQALPDLLPWAALIDNGVVLTKSGGLLAGFDFRGPDLDSATKEELAAVSARINAALALDDGWSLHVDATRIQSPGYPDGWCISRPDHAPHGRLPPLGPRRRVGWISK
jgi:type IV secretory pathway VirB4 component